MTSPEPDSVSMQATTNIIEKNELTLLFRGLGLQAYQDYLLTGMLLPYEGSLSTGKAVCFSNRLETALSFAASGVLVVTTRQLLDSERKAIDTRVSGYDEPFYRRLQLSRHNPSDGYTVWEEIQKYDTILREADGSITYARREPVRKSEIVTVLLIKKL